MLRLKFCAVTVPVTVKVPAGTVSVRVPTAMATGSYFVLACADDGNVAAESNEGNNCVASTTKVSITR